MDLKGIVFDKDGTLFDFNATWGAWADAVLRREATGDAGRFRALSQALGFDPKRKTFAKGSVVIAETIDVIADHMLPHLQSDDKAGLVARLNAGAKDVPQQEATDLVVLCRDLRARGLSLGIATNDAEESACAHLDRAGVTGFFEFIAGADSGFGGKPAPDQLLGFCVKTGLAPAACAMVGDSLHDMHAGRAAGMMTVGVLTGPASKADLAPFADAVLTSVADIPAWLVGSG